MISFEKHNEQLCQNMLQEPRMSDYSENLWRIESPTAEVNFFFGIISDCECSAEQNVTKSQKDDSKTQTPLIVHPHEPNYQLEIIEKTIEPTKKSAGKIGVLYRNQQVLESKVHAIKKIKKGKQTPKTKIDYKKNICGYVVRRGLKAALSSQYAQKIEQICKEFGVKPSNFYIVYKSYNLQNITGPTHFYILVNPNLCHSNQEKNICEIKIRMVFLAFFTWFLRFRYVRYLIHEGKMTQKDKYINYKNKQLLHLVYSQWQDALEAILSKLHDGQKIAKEMDEQLSTVYERLVEKNSIIGDLTSKQITESKSLPKSIFKNQHKNSQQNPQMEEQSTESMESIQKKCLESTNYDIFLEEICEG